MQGVCVCVCVDEKERGGKESMGVERDIGIETGTCQWICHCYNIRASVDALCRDDKGKISRDPRKTGRECQTRPSKLTKSHSRASIPLSTC